VDATLQSHRDNRLLAAIGRQTFQLMQPHLRSISMIQGHELYEPGDDIDQIYFPQSGLISLLVLGKNGSSVETSTVGREGALGLQGGFGPRRSFTRAIVQIAGKFSAIGATRFAVIAQDDRSLRDLIAHYTELVWAEAQQTAACNAQHEAAARLCRWLLQSADRIGQERVPLTQEFLAQMLGVRRTTVTLLAQSLQNDGLIKYSRGQIEILDRKKLERCSCECYSILQHSALPLAIGIKI